MTPPKTQALGRYLLISLAIIFSAMVISGCGGGGGDSSSTTSGTPNIGLVSAQTDFGVVVLGKTGDKHIEIWNTGGANLSIGQITPPANPFSMTDSCSGANIPPSSNCQLTIRFAPTSQGDFTGSFDIPSNDSDAGLITANLAGKGRALNLSINRVTRVGQTVQVVVSVEDRFDAPVTTLAASNFSLVENAIPISIGNVFNNMVKPPVSVGMVLDYSSTMIPFTQDVETAVKSFVDLLDPANDEAEVIKFATEISVMGPGFTQNHADLYVAIDEPPLFERAGTRLNDALLFSIDEISVQSNPQRAIIAVSDGQGDDSTGTSAQVIAGAGENNVRIFTIGIGAADNVTLGQLATGTGGQYFFDPSASDLTTIYSTISEILANEYTIEYTTSSAAGSTLSIQVVVDDNGSLSGGQLGETSKTVTL